MICKVLPDSNIYLENSGKLTVHCGFPLCARPPATCPRRGRSHRDTQPINTFGVPKKFSNLPRHEHLTIDLLSGRVSDSNAKPSKTMQEKVECETISSSDPAVPEIFLDTCFGPFCKKEQFWKCHVGPNIQEPQGGRAGPADHRRPSLCKLFH